MEDNNKLALIVAYYLSKFDLGAVRNLGYSSFKEAFENLGDKLSVNPNTIKNMRDEFDPIHENSRVGWYQRELRPSRQQVVERFEHLEEPELYLVINEIINNNDFRFSDTCNDMIRSISDAGQGENSKIFVLRGPTGRKAEEYFIEQFRSGNLPFSGDLVDKRDSGCGYDFEINNLGQILFIEVKGLADKSGGVLFTNKEWTMAQTKKQLYFLALISNVNTEPAISIFQDPASTLKATKRIHRPVQVNWTVTAGDLMGKL